MYSILSFKNVIFIAFFAVKFVSFNIFEHMAGSKPGEKSLVTSCQKSSYLYMYL